MSSAGARLHIQGMVQGVGYRYFCYDRARALELNGWVRNDPDGTVAVRVEGDRSGIESLISELKAGPPSANVTNIDVEWQRFTGEFTEFKVAF